MNYTIIFLLKNALIAVMCTDIIQNIQYPPKIPKRGRSKGSRTTTVIGLPKKRAHLEKPVPLVMMAEGEQIRCK